MTNKALLIANWSFEPRAGIEEEYWWPPLKGPKNDLALMVKTLTDRDYGLFDRDNITCCEDFAFGPLQEAIEEFFGKTDPDDYVLVYFTGHGYPWNGKLRLVTHDAHKRSWTSAMPIATIDDCVGEQNRAEQYVLILDCCYAGAAESAGDKGGGPAATLEAELLPGRWALYSSDQYTTSRDAMAPDQPSPFTNALCDALVNPALHGREDGVVTLAAVKDEMDRRLRQLAGNPPRPQLKVLSNGLDPGIAKRDVVGANPSTLIAELSHLEEEDDVIHWPAEIDDTRVDMLSHLSSLHDLAATLRHQADSRAKSRSLPRDSLESRTAEESQYLGRILGELLLTPGQVEDLQGHMLDPARLVRVQLSFPPDAANSVELLPWEYLTYDVESDGDQAAIAMLDGLTIERRGPKSAFQARDGSGDKITEVALIGSQNGGSVHTAETALRKDLAALDIQVSPTELGARYDSAQYLDQLPSVVVVLAGLKGTGGPSGRDLQVQFGPAEDWCPISHLGDFLKPRRLTDVAPYQAIIVETFASDPEHDSARATVRLASYLAGLKLGNVAFLGHPPGSSGCLERAARGEPKTFVGHVVRALNLGHPLHRAVYAAKMRIGKVAGVREREFGIPGMYQLTFAQAQDRSPRQGEARSRPQGPIREDRNGSRSGSPPVVGDRFVADGTPATSINVPVSGSPAPQGSAEQNLVVG